MEFLPLCLGLAVIVLGTSAAASGCISYAKHRGPIEGVLLGLALGPVGIWLASLRPYRHRPMVDQPARNSFRSVVGHQASAHRMMTRAPQLDRPQANIALDEEVGSEFGSLTAPR